MTKVSFSISKQATRMLIGRFRKKVKKNDFKRNLKNIISYFIKFTRNITMKAQKIFPSMRLGHNMLLGGFLVIFLR